MTGFYEEVGSTVPVGDHDLNYHTDVTITNPTNLQQLRYDLDSGRWVNYTPDVATVNLGELGDVDTTGATLGQYLQFDGSEWVPATQVTTLSLDDLSNVSVPSPNDAEVLTWSQAGGEWISSPVVGGGGGANNLGELLDVTLTTPANLEALVYNGSIWENQPIVRGLDDLSDVELASAGNGDFLFYDGTKWEDRAFSAPLPANPVTIGSGTNGTDVALHIDGGSAADDQKCVKFLEGGVVNWSICQAETLGDNFLHLNSLVNQSSLGITTTSPTGVKYDFNFGTDGYFRVEDGVVNITDSGSGSGFDLKQDGSISKLSSYGTVEISGISGVAGRKVSLFHGGEASPTISLEGSVGSEAAFLRFGGVTKLKTIDEGVEVVQGDLIVDDGDIIGERLFGQNLVTTGRLLKVGVLGLIEQSDIETTDIMRLSNNQVVTGFKQFTQEVEAASFQSTIGGLDSAGDVIIRAASPTEVFHATRKDYVDGALATKANASHTHSNYVTTNTTQTVTGAKTFTSTFNVQADADIQGELSGYSVFSTVGGIQSAGHVILGILGPTDSFHAASKTYVDAQVSDMRLKEDVKPIAGTLDRLQDLSTFTFSYKDGVIHKRSNHKVKYGMSAQEIQEVFPEAIHTCEFEDGIEYLGVDYAELVPVLVKSIQELTARVKELENK